MRAKPNQKVKCVDMRGSVRSGEYTSFPAEGKTYTIREVLPRGLRLKEVINPGGAYEGTFKTHRFVDFETGKPLRNSLWKTIQPEWLEHWFQNLNGMLVLYLFLFLIFISATIVTAIYGKHSDEHHPTADEVIADKIAHGEELNWLEKKVVKERQREGEKNNK